MASEAIAKRPKRRTYSPDLKSQVVAECQVQGASVAGIALAHGINANIVHRWLREHARAATTPAPPQGFVALALQACTVDTAPSDPATTRPERNIRIEVRRSQGSITVDWPLVGAESCAAWLRDWLRSPR